MSVSGFTGRGEFYGSHGNIDVSKIDFTFINALVEKAEKEKIEDVFKGVVRSKEKAKEPVSIGLMDKSKEEDPELVSVSANYSQISRMILTPETLSSTPVEGGSSKSNTSIQNGPPSPRTLVETFRRFVFGT